MPQAGTGWGACDGKDSMARAHLVAKGAFQNSTRIGLLHDCLAANLNDPATAAARRLDWAKVTNVLDPVATAVLLALLHGTPLALFVPRLKRSRTLLHDEQQRLGNLVCERLGRDIL